MNLKILEEIHPLVREVWEAGFDIDLQGEDFLLKELEPVREEDRVEHEKRKEALRQKVRSKKAGVLEYLADLKGLKVAIQSAVLGERVWIVGHPDLLPTVPSGEIAYLPQEVYKIKKSKMSLEQIQKLHALKKVFGGTILPT